MQSDAKSTLLARVRLKKKKKKNPDSKLWPNNATSPNSSSINFRMCIGVHTSTHNWYNISI